MKFKYINVSNCHTLLPGLFDMRVLRDFDSYRMELDNSKEHSGVVEKLIHKNQKTQSMKPWDRFLNYDIDVCLDMNFKTKEAVWRIQDKQTST